MAAIFGLVAKVGARTFDTDIAIQRMQRRLSHRAPDGFGTWQEARAALGHGALEVTAPAERSPQPLRLADGRIMVVDGFVSNVDDARRELRMDRSTLVNDACLIGLAIQQWDDRFHEHVHGEFALALWNPMARVLDLYSDCFGARPLRYVDTAEVFGFASESEGLFGLPGVRAHLDPAGIACMWYDEATRLDLEGTAFEGVFSLPPGHHLRWREGHRAIVRRYWQLEPREPLRLRDPREYVDAFQEVFRGAVANAMRGTQDTALMLSGGIDSAAILAARRGFQAGGQANDLVCVSAVLAPGITLPQAEAEQANIVALTAQHPRTLQFAVPTPSDRGGLVSSADLAEVAWSRIHPRDMSLLVPSLCARVARKNGCRLILNGVDGDVVASAGIHYIGTLVRQRQWRRAWSEAHQASRVNTYLGGQPPAWLFGRSVAAGLAPEVLRRLRGWFQTETAIRAIASHPMMSTALADRIDLPGRMRAVTRQRSERDPQQYRCDNMAHWLSISLGASNDIAARQGLEARHPWCDRAVVDFFLRLPAEYLTREGWTKYLVRKACEPAVGSGVAWHSGKDHLGAWLNLEVLRDASPYLQDLLLSQRPLLNAYVRPEAIDQALGLLEDAEALTRQECDTVLTIVSLAGWLHDFHENSIYRGHDNAS